MNAQTSVSLNMNVRGMGLSATLAINERCRLMRDRGELVYNMGLGQSPFPVPDSVVDALRLAAPEKDYVSVRGLPALREAVAAFHHKHDNLDTSIDRVLIGPGSKELMFLLQLAYYGEIIITAPCWVSYIPQARIIGRRVSIIQTSYEQHWMVTAEQLDRSFKIVQDDYRPRLLVLNYPSNPSGLTYSPDQLREIAEVARRYRVLVLSDEIYGQLQHDGKHTSIAQFYPEGTIVSSGLSKWCGAGGWRLGTFCFPQDLEWLADAMAAIASETYTAVSTPIQYAAVVAFHGGVEIERYLWHARRILGALGQRCATTLSDAGIRVHSPSGAFYLFVDFSPFHEKLIERGIHDGTTLCKRLLEEASVAALPGVSFARSRGELSARLSLVDFDGARVLAASENVPLHEPLPEDFIDTYCDRVVTGARRLAEWIANGKVAPVEATE